MARGANLMVQCLRTAMNDLSQLLADYRDNNGGGPNPLILPKRTVVQFDNCSENKVVLQITCLLMLSYYNCLGDVACW